MTNTEFDPTIVVGAPTIVVGGGLAGLTAYAEAIIHTEYKVLSVEKGTFTGKSFVTVQWIMQNRVVDSKVAGTD